MSLFDQSTRAHFSGSRGRLYLNLIFLLCSWDVNCDWFRGLFLFIFLQRPDFLNLCPLLLPLLSFKREEFLFELIDGVPDLILRILVKDVHHVPLEILHNLRLWRAVLLGSWRQQGHNLVKLLAFNEHMDHAVEEFGRNVGLVVQDTSHQCVEHINDHRFVRILFKTSQSASNLLTNLLFELVLRILVGELQEFDPIIGHSSLRCINLEGNHLIVKRGLILFTKFLPKDDLGELVSI